MLTSDNLIYIIIVMQHKETVVKNAKVKDNGAKLIFDDPILCAEFLRGYVDIDLLKDVQPEDIEDISERFLPMWQNNLHRIII